MAEQIKHSTENNTTMSASEVEQVSGGASIYVDGRYWGEGDLDLRPWPGGFSVVQRPNMRFI